VKWTLSDFVDRCRKELDARDWGRPGGLDWQEWVMIFSMIAGVLIALPGLVLAMPFFWLASRFFGYDRRP
jgi:hypothetical protein